MHIYYSLIQFPWKEVSILPVQWHALAFGLFASIIAPFGGFFASGFKRAFKIKVISYLFCSVQKGLREFDPFQFLCSRILVIAFLDMAGLRIEWIAK